MPSLGRRLALWRAMSARERRELARACVALPAFVLAVRLRGVSPFRDQLVPQSRAQAGADPAALHAATRAVRLAARILPLHTSCLARSLCLAWLLRRQGIACTVRIGARMVDKRLDAHAWVECAGVPLNDDADVAQRFAPLAHRHDARRA